MKIISKKEAKAKNLVRYYTGEPCKYGHYSERSVRNGDCIDCKNARSREKRKNKEVKLKEQAYRSTDEYKRRKAFKSRLRNHVRIIDAGIKKVKDRERAGEMYISKDDAKFYGLARYFDGSLCKRGHMSHRLVSNNSCCECAPINASKPERVKNKKKYYRNNKDHLMPLNVKRQREMYSESKEKRVGVAARNMLKRVLRAAKQKKRGGTYEILGYTREELMEHLESLFLEGMSWDNYGEWHIDHIRPVSTLVSEGVTDPSIINALYNLQPLWASDNLAKSNKLL